LLSQFADVGQFDGLFNPAPGFAHLLPSKCLKTPSLWAIIARKVNVPIIITANWGMSIGHFLSSRLYDRLIYGQPVEI
jgi:hypothetical protein